MMNREKAKHIDAFKYWCESNEENGVITIPKFLCEHIVEILDDAKARPHGEWIYHKECAFECSKCGMGVDVGYNFCPNCGADMREEGGNE